MQRHTRFDHLHHLTLDSTHLWCKREREALEKKLHRLDYLIVSAKKQTAGVGRQLSRWQSGEQSLTFNLLLQDPVDTSSLVHPQVSQFSQASAMALCEKLIEKGVPCQIKWPNDLITSEGKLGGIVLERLQGNQGAWLCIGIGLNLTPPPKEAIDQATDSLETYRFSPDPLAFIEELGEKIYQRLHELKKSPLYEGSYLENAYFQKGDRLSLQQLELSKPPKPLLANFEKIDVDGRLHLITQEGTMIALTSSECSQVRKK